MEFEQNVAANVEEVATPQPEVTESVEQEVTAEPTQEPTEDITQTQAFSKRLREATTQAEEKARDAVIAEMYGHQGITTYKQYQQALERQRYIDEGKDPELYQELNSVKSELHGLRQEKEDQELRNDPIRGEIYKEWEQEVKAVSKQYGSNLKTAFLLLLDERLPDVLNKTMSKAEQTAIQKIQQNQSTSTGSLSEGSTNTGQSIHQMSKAEFEKLQERVLRGEIKNL